MSTDIKELIEKRLCLAQFGRKLWFQLREKYGITDRTYVVVIPSCEGQEDTYVINTMEHLINLKKPDKVIIIVAKQVSECKYPIVDFIECTDEEISAILCLYSMYRFTPNLIIASLTKPDGRMGSGMLKKGNMDIEELFNMVSFGF